MRVSRNYNTPNIDVQFTATYYKQTFDEATGRYDIDFTSPLINNIVKVVVSVNEQLIPIIPVQSDTSDSRWVANVEIKCEELGLNIRNLTEALSTGKITRNIELNKAVTVETKVRIFRKNDYNKLEQYVVEKAITISCEPAEVVDNKVEASVDLYGISNAISIVNFLNPAITTRIPFISKCKQRGVYANHKIAITFNGEDNVVSNDANYVIPAFNNNITGFIPIDKIKKHNSIKAVITPCNYEYNQKQKQILLELWEANKVITPKQYNLRNFEGRLTRGFHFITPTNLSNLRENRGSVYKLSFTYQFVGSDKTDDDKAMISVFSSQNRNFDTTSGFVDMIKLTHNNNEPKTVEGLFVITDRMINSNKNSLAVIAWVGKENYIKISSVTLVEVNASNVESEELWMKLHRERVPSKEITTTSKPITIYKHFDVIVPPFETFITINKNRIVNIDELIIDKGKVVLYAAVRIGSVEIIGEDLEKIFNVTWYANGTVTSSYGTGGKKEFPYESIVDKNIFIYVESKFV